MWWLVVILVGVSEAEVISNEPLPALPALHHFDHVEVHDLMKAPEMNGMKAMVESWQPQLTRYLVRDQNSDKTFLVRRENLRLLKSHDGEATPEAATVIPQEKGVSGVLSSGGAAALSGDKAAGGGVAEKKLIITLASGRELFDLTRPAMQAYADRIGAEFRVVAPTDVYIPESLQQAFTERLQNNQHAPGVTDSWVYPRKLLAVHQALAEADRVLWLDDSVYIKPDSPDLFSVCPRTADVCAHTEGADKGMVGEGTWYNSKKFLAAQNVTATVDQYANTGVVVYNQGARWSLSPWTMEKNVELFNGRFVDQEYLCSQVVASHLSVHNIGSSYNVIPGPRPFALDKASHLWPSEHMDNPAVKMIHVTSWIANPVIRLGVVRQIRDHFAS